MVLLAAVFWQRRGRMRGEGVFLELEESDSSLAAEVAMAPSDSGFDPRQRRHLIHT